MLLHTLPLLSEFCQKIKKHPRISRNAVFVVFLPRDSRHDRACGSGNVIRPESPKKTPLDHWRVAIIRGATPVSPSQSRSFMVERAGNGCTATGEGGRERGGEGAVKQWDADKLGCVLETSWHSYRQTVVGARQMLLDCPESPGNPPFFPARDFRDEARRSRRGATRGRKTTSIPRVCFSCRTRF